MIDYATTLADGIEAALPAWVERSVARVMTAYAEAAGPAGSTGQGGPAAAPAEWAVPAEVAAAARAAGLAAAAAVGPQIRRLLEADLDDQHSTPLAILRALAVEYPTSVLRQAGVPPVARDAFTEGAFPDDLYDLVPASFADLDPRLADAGLAWGAAKAFEHRRRHGGGT